MGHALIWIESLAAVLVFLALVTAWASRFNRPRVQRWTPIIIAFLAVAFAGFVTFIAGGFRFAVGWEGVPFFYVLFWSISLLGGAIIVLTRGLRRTGESATPAARAWPLEKLALAFGVLVVVDLVTLWNLDLAVRVQMTSLRLEAGARVLAAMPPRVPDRENAALVYQRAFDALATKDTAPPLFEPWPREERFDPRDEKLRAFLRTQEPGLTLLRKAAAMPACSFEHNLVVTQYTLMLPPELDKLRHGARLLASDAVSKAAHGEGPAAIENVAAILGIARHVDRSLLISLLHAIACERIAVKALEDVLTRVSPPPEELAKLVLDDYVPYQNSVKRALQIEEAIGGLPIFADLGSDREAARKVITMLSPQIYDGESAAFFLVDLPIYRVFLLADDLAAYRQAMREIEELAQPPYYKSREGWGKFAANRGRGYMTSMITPALTKCIEAAANGDAHRQLCRVALAATAFRARTGKYPEKLEDLTPEFLPNVPLDPYDGQPLRLKREGKGIVLYSIGFDLKDDGGKSPAPGAAEGDIVFRLRLHK